MSKEIRLFDLKKGDRFFFKRGKIKYRLIWKENKERAFQDYKGKIKWSSINSKVIKL